mgnify:CR=1 FL=1
MAIAVRMARARIESRAATKARSTAAPKRLLRQRLVGEGLQHAHRADQFGCIGGGVGERVLRRARAPAHRAAEAVERQHDHRDRREHKGGKPAGSSPPSWRSRPTNRTTLRNATEIEAPTAALICVVSAVSREISLAGLGRIEVGGRERDQMAEHALAQVGHDPLAQRGDEIKARRARQSEHGHDADQDGEIAVDQARTLAARTRNRSSAGPRSAPPVS